MKAKKSRRILTRAAAVLATVAAALLIVFLLGRYGWKLGGFRACESAGIASVEVQPDSARLTGFYPGSFPTGFCGYYAEERDGTLLVGFRFSAVFGIFETGDFDITIPVKGEIRQVVVKTARAEYPIWSAESEPAEEEPAPEEASTVPEAYAAVIGEYYTALHELWDGAEMMEAGLNYMAADSVFDDPTEDIGYAVADLDGDGVLELVIGAIKEDPFFGKLIFSLYTMRDGVPLLLFDSTERCRYYYAGGRNFANLGSSDWNESFATTLKLEDGELIDMTYTTDPGDYVQMALTPISQWVP